LSAVFDINTCTTSTSTESQNNCKARICQPDDGIPDCIRYPRARGAELPYTSVTDSVSPLIFARATFVQTCWIISRQNSLYRLRYPPLASGMTDLSTRCSRLLNSLNYRPSDPLSPITIPRIIYEHTLQHSGASPSIPALLDGLSLLAAFEGISELVLREFQDIALDLLARWLDTTDLTAAQWEQRLVILASLGDLRPDLWG
jgi:hypothetical protein